MCCQYRQCELWLRWWGRGGDSPIRCNGPGVTAAVNYHTSFPYWQHVNPTHIQSKECLGFPVYQPLRVSKVFLSRSVRSPSSFITSLFPSAPLFQPQKFERWASPASHHKVHVSHNGNISTLDFTDHWSRLKKNVPELRKEDLVQWPNAWA